MFKGMAFLKAYATSFLKWLYNYSSARFVVEKAFPSDNPIKPNAFLISLVSIYIATYTLATGLHESRRHSLERRVSSLSIQLQSEDKKAALKKIAVLQNTQIPPKPRFVSFRSPIEFVRSAWSPLKTILTEDVDKEIVQDLKELVETYKSHLEGADLSNANLSYADLSKAKMNGALFIDADLSNADFSNAMGQKSNFAAAKLRNTNFSGANLNGSLFDVADMLGARFTFSSLKDASFYRATASPSTDWVGVNLLEAGIVNTDADDVYYIEGCFSQISGGPPPPNDPRPPVALHTLCGSCYTPIFRVRLDRLRIDLDSYSHELRRLVELLKSWPELSIRIKGHVSEMGTGEYNLVLAQKLADSLASYLVSNGIEQKRIDTVSYGKEKLIDRSKSSARHLKNNRVELEFIFPNQKTPNPLVKSAGDR
jgi:hypothetical protein